MNRRHFLNLAALGTAGMVLDPERLLWVPGQRTFFLPPAEGWAQTRLLFHPLAFSMLFEGRSEWVRVLASEPGYPIPQEMDGAKLQAVFWDDGKRLVKIPGTSAKAEYWYTA